MPRKTYGREQIIGMLREADVALGQGRTVSEVCRGLGITSVTYYRWRKEYGGLKLDQAKRLKELERENARLRKAVSDLRISSVAPAHRTLPLRPPPGYDREDVAVRRQAWSRFSGSQTRTLD